MSSSNIYHHITPYKVHRQFLICSVNVTKYKHSLSLKSLKIICIFRNQFNRYVVTIVAVLCVSALSVASNSMKSQFIGLLLPFKIAQCSWRVAHRTVGLVPFCFLGDVGCFEAGERKLLPRKQEDGSAILWKLWEVSCVEDGDAENKVPHIIYHQISHSSSSSCLCTSASFLYLTSTVSRRLWNQMVKLSCLNQFWYCWHTT